MTTDSFFALTCAATLALFFGSVLAFAGYRFFLFLLPILGFFWGFALGAQSIQVLFGTGFLADVTSWVAGFFLGLLFAALSYLFFAAAVAIAAASLGYTLGTGIMMAIGFDMGLITWLVGVALAIALVAVVFFFDIYKWLIILATSVLGAATIVGTFLFLFGRLPTSELIQNPVQVALRNSPLWWVLGIAIAAIGFAVQYVSTRYWTLKSYSRWDEVYSNEAPAETIVPSSTMATTSAGLTPAAAGASPSGGMAPLPPVEAPPVEAPPPPDTPQEPPIDRNP